MDGTGDHPVKGNKPDPQRQILHVLSHMLNLDLKGTEGHEHKRGTMREEEREGERQSLGAKYDQSILYVCMQIV
jgi:hypothetical protein